MKIKVEQLLDPVTGLADSVQNPTVNPKVKCRFCGAETDNYIYGAEVCDSCWLVADEQSDNGGAV